MSHSHFRLLLAFIAINVFVISIIAEEKPLAVMKAEYSVLAKSHLTSDGDTVMTENDFVLQIAPGYSCYYSPRTYYVDSLQHDPAGQLVYDRISREAMEAFMTSGKNYFESMKAQGLFKESSMFDVKDSEPQQFLSGIQRVATATTTRLKCPTLCGRSEIRHATSWAMSAYWPPPIITDGNGRHGLPRRFPCRMVRGSSAVSPD